MNEDIDSENETSNSPHCPQNSICPGTNSAAPTTIDLPTQSVDSMSIPFSSGLDQIPLTLSLAIVIKKAARLFETLSSSTLTYPNKLIRISIGNGQSDYKLPMGSFIGESVVLILIPEQLANENGEQAFAELRLEADRSAANLQIPGFPNGLCARVPSVPASQTQSPNQNQRLDLTNLMLAGVYVGSGANNESSLSLTRGLNGPSARASGGCSLQR